jgi:hypothetical protein
MLSFSRHFQGARRRRLRLRARSSSGTDLSGADGFPARLGEGRSKLLTIGLHRSARAHEAPQRDGVTR